MTLTWRELGGSGEAYPAWVRALRNRSGVYAIRTRGWVFNTVVYVGESHTGGLYKTLTRHFQSWSRDKKSRDKLQWIPSLSWLVSPDRPGQTDPGHTYKRADVEVAVRVAKSREHALELQAEWITKLQPRDNVAAAGGELEDAPF